MSSPPDIPRPDDLTWYKALEPDELAEGRVKPVTCAHMTVCMTHHQGRYNALDNRCPHQGGPLGEGSIEKGWLRCPWHGWDYDPHSGDSPGGHDDGVEVYPTEVREDGVYLADIHIPPAPQALERAVALLAEVRRPAIVVGHGARFDMPAIQRLAEAMNAPVLTTFKGKGLIADDHPLAGGVLGRSGTPIASWFMNEADALLVLGASFSNHTGIEAKKRIIQVDFDRMALAKFHPIEVPVWGELCGALGIRVTDPDQLDDALSEALDHPGPSTVEILTDPDLV